MIKSTNNLTMVSRVILANYRNYSACQANLKQFNILYGNNGSGKTNFLEALSLLSPGKGLRGANFEELLSINNPNLATNFTITSNYSTNQVSLNNNITYENEVTTNKKNILLDDEPLKNLKSLTNVIKPLWLTPKMDTIFLEDNTVQRNFFDRLIFNFDSLHLSRLASYNKALKQRNILLKTKSNNASWFNALEDILTTNGIAIVTTRIAFLNTINTIISQQASSYFANISLDWVGFIEDLLVTQQLPALACEKIIKNTLQTNREADYQMGSTSIGSHKSNFVATNLFNNIVAKNCSTGEQKRILITIIIAVVKLLIVQQNTNILLLLDEILVHLDTQVRDSLLQELVSMPLQFIITATDTIYFSNFKQYLNFLEVKNNTIIQGST